MGSSIKKKSVIIPPYWVDFLVGILSILLALWSWNVTENMTYRKAVTIRMICGIGILLLFKTCFHYSIHEKGIMVRFLWIPVWLVKWEKISSAEYVYNWFTGAKWGKMEGQGIFVTLQGCPYFSPEIDALNIFQLKHAFRCFFIRFTPMHQKRYVNLFNEYYPALEFQIGYEDNLNKN